MIGIDEERERLNSLLYWYPKIQGVVPTPKTVWVAADAGALLHMLDHKPLSKDFVRQLGEKAEEIGYPLFMRTANVSGKFEWKDTCYVTSKDKLLQNLYHLVEFNFCLMPAPDIDAIIFREFLDLDSRFTAFSGHMPVARERRYFIRDGKVVCRHNYWPIDAIVNPSVEDWQPLLQELNTELLGEVGLLTRYCELVGKKLNGFWSVDFCMTRKGDWYLTDMAVGERSYHEPTCPYNRTPEIDLITGEVKKPWEHLGGVGV